MKDKKTQKSDTHTFRNFKIDELTSPPQIFKILIETFFRIPLKI